MREYQWKLTEVCQKLRKKVNSKMAREREWEISGNFRAANLKKENLISSTWGERVYEIFSGKGAYFLKIWKFWNISNFFFIFLIFKQHAMFITRMCSYPISSWVISLWMNNILISQPYGYSLHFCFCMYLDSYFQLLFGWPVDLHIFLIDTLKYFMRLNPFVRVKR